MTVAYAVMLAAHLTLTAWTWQQAPRRWRITDLVIAAVLTGRVAYGVIA